MTGLLEDMVLAVIRYESNGDLEKGGHHKDPNDRGGWTQFGLAENYHPDLASKIAAGTLTLAEARARYLRDYFGPVLKLAPLPLAMNFWLFDARVHGSGDEAIEVLQRYLNDVHAANLKVDGWFGPITANAVRNLTRQHLTAALWAIALSSHDIANDMARDLQATGTNYDYTKGFAHRLRWRTARALGWAVSDA